MSLMRVRLVQVLYEVEHLLTVCNSRKPTTRKGKQILLSREPKLLEAAKNTLFLEGRKCSGHIRNALKDLYHLKKPLAKALSRSNDLTPFEDDVKLQNQIVRNECNLFVFGSSSKKRPNNLVLGRLYEHEILDMVELFVSEFKGLADFKNEKVATHCKPCLVFNGPKWSETEELRRLKSLLIDSFHRETVNVWRIYLRGKSYFMIILCRWKAFDYKDWNM